MNKPTIGQKAPAFSNKNQSDTLVSLDDFKGKNLVLYFYPKDDTPGCTTEAKDFTAMSEAFSAANTVVVGVSKDSIAKHQKFINKHELCVDLLSDEDGNVCESYGVWVEKSMYGKKYMGIERTTFLIDSEGMIQHVWEKVKVKSHAQEVLDTAQRLNG